MISKNILAIIPARGGTKGLPGKNKMNLCGKPLIAWSIETALDCSGYINKLIVSTDDKDIAEISKSYKAEVPFIRPDELASDDATTISVIYHTIDWLKCNQSYEPDSILLLQPTSPLRIKKDILNAIDMTNNKNIRSVVSVCKTNHHPWWSNTLPEDGNMGTFLKNDIIHKRRQELPDFYRLNGAIFFAKLDYFYKYNGFFGPKTFAYKMGISESIDIDSEIDFKLASILKDEQINSKI